MTEPPVNSVIDLERLAVDAQALRIPTQLQGRLTAIPNDYTLHDLEKYLPAPERFRGRYCTSSLADFVAYVKQHGGEGFIEDAASGDKLSAVAFHNMGEKDAPGHADWRSELTIRPTAAYAAMLAIEVKPLVQRDLVDWLEDWADHVEAFGADPGNYKPWAEALAAIRKITVATKREDSSAHGDLRQARSAMEEVEARAEQGIPGGFRFKCEPYQGLASRTFILRLSVRTGGDVPLLVLRIMQREAAKEAIVNEFKEVLLREVGDAAVLRIGSFARNG